MNKEKLIEEGYVLVDDPNYNIGVDDYLLKKEPETESDLIARKANHFLGKSILSLFRYELWSKNPYLTQKIILSEPRKNFSHSESLSDRKLWTLKEASEKMYHRSDDEYTLKVGDVVVFGNDLVLGEDFSGYSLLESDLFLVGRTKGDLSDTYMVYSSEPMPKLTSDEKVSDVLRLFSKYEIENPSKSHEDLYLKFYGDGSGAIVIEYTGAQDHTSAIGDNSVINKGVPLTKNVYSFDSIDELIERLKSV